jgi:hypothetical protein
MREALWLEKFWARVDKSGECWVWTGSKKTLGYGLVCYRGQLRTAHRVAYEIFVGPLRDGLFVCHSCDNPPCVNPAHLWQGTASDNTRDAMSKGRLVIPRFSRENDSVPPRTHAHTREHAVQRRLPEMQGLCEREESPVLQGQKRRRPLSVDAPRRPEESNRGHHRDDEE